MPSPTHTGLHPSPFGLHHFLRTDHPAANGLVDRLHRTLQAAIMCHADEQWTEALPQVLLGIRTTYKENQQLSAAKLVDGELLRVPGKLLAPAVPNVEPSAFYSSSAAAWTSCDQPRQRAFRPLLHSFTGISSI